MFGYSSWNDFMQDAAQKFDEAKTAATEKAAEINTTVSQTANEMKEKMAEKAKEYEIEKHATTFSSNITTGVYSAVDSVSAFVEETVNSLEEENDENTKREMKKKQRKKALKKGVLPWSVLEHVEFGENLLEEAIRSLADDKKNVLDSAPEDFQFHLVKMLPFAYGVLDKDKTLAALRLDVVPSHLKEKYFWRNYFYRVSLIRKNIGVEPLDPEKIDLYATEISEEKGLPLVIEKLTKESEPKLETKEANLLSRDNMSIQKKVMVVGETIEEEMFFSKKSPAIEVKEEPISIEIKKNKLEASSSKVESNDLNLILKEKETKKVEEEEEKIKVVAIEKEEEIKVVTIEKEEEIKVVTIEKEENTSSIPAENSSIDSPGGESMPVEKVKEEEEEEEDSDDLLSEELENMLDDVDDLSDVSDDEDLEALLNDENEI